MSGVSVAKKNGGQTSAIFANDTRWRPNSQILHRRDRSNSRVTETARPLGVPPSAARPSGVLLCNFLYFLTFWGYANDIGFKECLVKPNANNKKSNITFLCGTQTHMGNRGLAHTYHNITAWEYPPGDAFFP